MHPLSPSQRISDRAVWCEMENGEYTADLSLWSGLCSPAPLSDSPAPTHGARTVLELGAGVGRVAVALGALGAEVWALDLEQEVLDELVRRAEARGLGGIHPIRADARSYRSRGRRFDLVIAPQAFVQMFEARADRVAAMTCAAAHLTRFDGSSFWMTFQPDLDQAWDDAEGVAPFPHVTELDGRVFELEPLDAYWHSHDGERSLRVVWSRRADGQRSTAQTSYAEVTQAALEDEASEARLELADSLTLPGSNGFLDQVALRFVPRRR